MEWDKVFFVLLTVLGIGLMVVSFFM